MTAWRRFVSAIRRLIGASSSSPQRSELSRVNEENEGASGIELSFGMREAIAASLIAIVIACFAAWRSLNG